MTIAALFSIWAGAINIVGNHPSGPHINTTVSETSPLIGERVVLRVEVSCPSGAKIKWPTIKESYGSHEILYEDVKTISSNKDWEKQSLEVALTNFTPGSHTLPALPVKVSTLEDTFILHSGQITIQYGLPTVDLTLPFKEIHPSVDVEYTHAKLLPHKIGPGLTITLVAILLLFYTGLSPHPWIGHPRSPQYYRRTISSLAELEISSDVHNQLYVILRAYIQERYTIPSSSATTQEIISQLRAVKLEEENLRNIACVLEETDRARFASNKYSPVDTGILLKTSKAFVLGTKPIR